MVSRNSKSFIFSVFFSINLLVSGLYAAEQAKAVAPYVVAAMVAGTLEKRVTEEKWSMPIGFINKTVPNECTTKTVSVQLPLPAQGASETPYAYDFRLSEWAKTNNATLIYGVSEENASQNHAVAAVVDQEVTTVDSTKHCIGIRFGNIPVQVTVPNCENIKTESSMYRTIMQILNADVILPGANLKNAVEIAAVLKLGAVASKYVSLPSASEHVPLPSQFNFKRK